MEYTLEYTPNLYYRREMVRRIFLAIAVVLDLVGIGLIFSAIIKSLMWIAVVISFVISIVSRIIVNRYPKKYEYGIKNGRFYINEITPARTRSILEIEINNVEDVIIANNIYKNAISNDKSIIVLCDNSCMNEIYVLKLRDKSVIIPLDEYIYTLLTSEIRG